MSIFFIIILLITSALIINYTGVIRAALLFFGIFFLNDIIRIEPFNSYTILIFAFIISLFTHKEIKEEIFGYPFLRVSALILVLHFCIAFFDSRLNLIQMFSRSLSNFLPTYFAFFVGYSLIRDYEEYDKTIKWVVIFIFIMAIYGGFTFIIQRNPYYDLLVDTFQIRGIWSEVQIRGYRVLSTLSNPIVFGAISAMGALLLWNEKIIFNKSNLYVFFPVILTNCLLANSRTSTATMLLMFGLYFTFGEGITKSARNICFGILALFLLYEFVPAVQDNINNVYTTIMVADDNSLHGSNLELKNNQWIASLYFFRQSPFFGNGFDYFGEVITKSGAGGSNSEMLAGLEGYIYKLLVEQGIFMIIASVSFFFFLIRFFIKNVFSDFSILAIALIAGFIFFIISTGTYGGIFTMFGIIIGMLIKMTQIQNEEFEEFEETTNFQEY